MILGRGFGWIKDEIRNVIGSKLQILKGENAVQLRDIIP